MRIKKYLMYPIAYFGISVLMQSLVSWYAYFYAPPKDNPYGLVPLVPIGLVGIAMIIGRIVDAVTDPLVAYWSDNLKSGMGRRRPFLIFGVVPFVLSYILVWHPMVGYESILNFIYLSVMLALYFTFFTIYVAPYLALLPEIAKDPDERATVSTYQSVFNTIGLLFQGVACPILIAQFGVQAMGIILGLLSFMTLLMPIHLKEEKTTRYENKFSIKESFIMTLKNREFLIYEASNLFYWFGINMVTIALPYVASVVMGLKGFETALLQGLLFIDAIIISPLILLWIKRYGKKPVYNISMVVFAVCLFVMYFVGKPYLFFNEKWFGFLVVGLAGFPLSSVFIIPNAIIADITDIDEMSCGQRREAMFFGVQGFLVKSVIGLSSFFTTGILFKYFGYNVGSSHGISLSIITAGICVIIGLIIFRGYSVEEGKLSESYKEYRASL
ncbi:MAG: MFS transporter [Thermoanaerobacteraceae bacterium]|nr:MFS transporter [Thermoanaerobacteraceae bacterium]